jgi:ribosomal protein S3
MEPACYRGWEIYRVYFKIKNIYSIQKTFNPGIGGLKQKNTGKNTGVSLARYVRLRPGKNAHQAIHQALDYINYL